MAKGWILLAIFATASAFTGVPAMRPQRAAVAMTTAQRPRVLSIIRAPFAAVASVYRRCDDFACRVGPPRPIAFLKSFIPQKRPLVQCVNNECSLGVYKVQRVGSERCLVLIPTRVKPCSVEDALELF